MALYSGSNKVAGSGSGIVESGSNENGSYIKFSDGTMICTMLTKISVTSSLWFAWGSLFACNQGQLQNNTFPQNFIDTPYVSITTSNPPGALISYSECNNTSILNIVLARGEKPTSDSVFTLSAIAIGRWK